MHSLGIISLNFTNSKSFCNILDNLQIKYEIISNARDIKKFDKIILPGTGSFQNALYEMRRKCFVSELFDHCTKNKYFLGVCLGMQILFSRGYEGGAITEGLNLIKGEVIKIVSKNKSIIHIGWNETSINQNIPLLNGINEEENFYFMHGYQAIAEEKVEESFSNFGENKILSVVRKDNLFGIQFHPEKSHIPGQKILRNFYNL